MIQLMLSNIQVKENILDDDKYKFLFSVEEVNKLVLSGMPFRDAYKKVGFDIEQGKYNPEKSVNHTHEGSIGNLCHDEIKAMMDSTLESFRFKQVDEAFGKLLA
jgi:argininosuccinate lyase